MDHNELNKILNSIRITRNDPQSKEKGHEQPQILEYIMEFSEDVPVAIEYSLN